MRLIDADATRKNILNLKMSQITRIKTLERIMMMEWCRAEMLKIIDNAPTIDAEPARHGRWIRMDDSFARWQCSACDAKNHNLRWDFCPNCGAKMDAEDINAPTNEANKICPINGAPCNECVPGAYCAKMDGGADNA